MYSACPPVCAWTDTPIAVSEKQIEIEIVCSVGILLISYIQLSYLFIKFYDKRYGRYTDSRNYFDFTFTNYNLSDLQ